MLRSARKQAFLEKHEKQLSREDILVAEEQPDNAPIRSPLSLGSLENRSPTLLLWNGPTGVPLWNEASNWSGAGIPRSGDVAVFQRPAKKAPEAGGEAGQQTDGCQ
jgi:hypothetical protein